MIDSKLFRCAEEVCVRVLDEALSKASRHYDVNGFGVVFEIGQPRPSMELALNTRSAGRPDVSTGEWEFPAGGFNGAELPDEWTSCYAKLDAYMLETGSEERINYVIDFFCSVLKRLRQRWKESLYDCVFTVNERNDGRESLEKIFESINN